MMLPHGLQPHDKVALIAPCSPIDPQQVAPAAEMIRDLGYSPVVFPSCLARGGYLAGSDRSRADDVNAAFADRSIKAIVAIRGGYGAARLAKYLKYDIIKANPKLFCGFSDVTLLHGILNNRCGIVTFHTPMPGVAAMRRNEDCRAALAAVLRGSYAEAMHLFDAPTQSLCGGTAEGILTGGNLTVIASTVGTPYQLETAGRILFLEDVGEKAYAIDRALVQLRDAGLLQNCAGILLGTWQHCEAPEGMTLDDVFREHFAPLHIPVIAHLPCGHSVPSLALPLGLPVRMEQGVWYGKHEIIE